MRAATNMLQEKHPEMIVEGEMQAHLAFRYRADATELSVQQTGG
jgi:phosphotransacetylase